MGASTDAIVFYGYVWKDEETLFREDDEWKKRIAASRGVTEPAEPYPEDRDQSATASAICERYSEYWDRQEKAVKQAGCEVGVHCSGDCPMPYVSVSDSVTMAHRGYPKELPAIVTKPEWDQQLASFCEALDIEPPQEKPRWWLVSWWD